MPRPLSLTSKRNILHALGDRLRSLAKQHTIMGRITHDMLDVIACFSQRNTFCVLIRRNRLTFRLPTARTIWPCIITCCGKYRTVASLALNHGQVECAITYIGIHITQCSRIIGFTHLSSDQFCRIWHDLHQTTCPDMRTCMGNKSAFLAH